VNSVILIAIDTLRAEQLSCYGYKNLTTPHIDKISQEGVIFENMFSPHIPTHPGFTTMMTGVDVMKHQIICQNGKVELDERIKTLPQILKENGYFTTAADNMGMWFKRGFDLYESYEWAIDSYEWRKAEAVNNVALRHIELAAKQDKPFFCFIHYWDPHTPYLPPKPFDRMFYGKDETDPKNRSMEPVLNFPPFAKYFNQWMGHVTDIKFPCAQYDGAIAYCDATLATLFRRIEELGLFENSALIITSDHGEELDEHGCWFDHHGLYDTNIHIPLIIKCPDRIPPNSKVRGMVSMLDLAPTILDLLGIPELADENGMLGKSLIPLLNKPEQGTSEILFLTESSWMRKRGVRTNKWKFIQACEPDIHRFPEIELYDLEDDKKEQNNVAQKFPEVVEEMKHILDKWVSKRLRETGLPNPIKTQDISLREVGNQEIPLPRKKRKIHKNKGCSLWFRGYDKKLETARLVENELRNRGVKVEFFDEKILKENLGKKIEPIDDIFEQLIFIISLLESNKVVNIIIAEPEKEETVVKFRNSIERLVEINNSEQDMEKIVNRLKDFIAL